MRALRVRTELPCHVEAEQVPCELNPFPIQAALYIKVHALRDFISYTFLASICFSKGSDLAINMRVVNCIVFSILIAAQVSLQDILKPNPKSFHGLHRRGTTSLLEPRHHPNILERRDVAPSPQCPESIGANPIFCDAGECGKEDPEKKGQCARMNCKCDGSSESEIGTPRALIGL